MNYITISTLQKIDKQKDIIIEFNIIELNKI